MLEGKSFNAFIGFKNSLLVASFTTLLTLYFYALTAHALASYNWKLRKPFFTFNRIVLPIMKPALATQGIFAFVTSWNALFMPMVLLTSSENYIMPLMVHLLRGDIYNTEYGAIYLALTLTILPLFLVYFSLSKYIIAGVALGGVKG